MMAPTIKASELKQFIMALPDDADVWIGQNSEPLTIYRVKKHDKNLFNIEFNEAYQLLRDLEYGQSRL